MMHTKHHRTLWARLSMRREISLWACLFAVLFQLASPLMQVAVSNSALAQSADAFPNEICSVFGNRVSKDSPTHHAMACEFCALCQMLHHDGKIPLVVSNIGFEGISGQGDLVPYSHGLRFVQDGYVYGAIRAPPTFV